MAEFLSEEWFLRLGQILSAVTVGSEGEAPLALGQVITNTTSAPVSYTILLGAGRPGSLARGSVDSATVTLVEDFESARGIVEGESVIDMLSSGKIKIRGDVNALLRAQDELAEFARALSAPD